MLFKLVEISALTIDNIIERCRAISKFSKCDI